MNGRIEKLCQIIPRALNASNRLDQIQLGAVLSQFAEHVCARVDGYHAESPLGERKGKLPRATADVSNRVSAPES